MNGFEKSPAGRVMRLMQDLPEKELIPEAWLKEVPKVCEECGQNYADYQSKTCVGCDAYRDHTQ